MFVIVFSVATMVFESFPHYSYNEAGDENLVAKGHFFILETICIMIFTLEYGARWYCVPEKCSFMMQPMNVIDFLAIAPYYLELLFIAIQVGASDVRMLRLLRLARVFRVLKLVKYNRSIAVAMQALMQSTDIFFLMIFMLTLLCVVFASFEFNFEEPSKNDDSMFAPVEKFASIPIAMWWCIVTVMMVGYGDMFPVTVVGKLCASICIVVGILIMALPISVIGSNFSRVWEEYEETLRKEEKARQAARVLTPEEMDELEREKIERINIHYKLGPALMRYLEYLGLSCLNHFHLIITAR
jgi:hypothetical protein